MEAERLNTGWVEDPATFPEALRWRCLKSARCVYRKYRLCRRRQRKPGLIATLPTMEAGIEF
jgi:hypothetical protein